MAQLLQQQTEVCNLRAQYLDSEAGRMYCQWRTTQLHYFQIPYNQ